MKLADIIKELELVVYHGGNKLDKEVSGAYVSDLLSDVMGHAREGNIWITLQAHLNVVAIASLKELSAIILVKGIQPGLGVREKAMEEDIPLLGIRDNTFETAGRLYEMLKGG
jgi:hypothetical protein